MGCADKSQRTENWSGRSVSDNRVYQANTRGMARRQYVDAHIPSKMNAFRIRLTAMAVHTSNLANGALRLVRLRFNSVTIAIIVVMGVMKRNHRVKISARFRRGQNGMLRSIGNAMRKAKNPSREGKHHQSDNQILSWRRSVSSEPVTLYPSTSYILSVPVQLLCLVSREIGN